MNIENLKINQKEKIEQGKNTLENSEHKTKESITQETLKKMNTELINIEDNQKSISNIEKTISFENPTVINSIKESMNIDSQLSLITEEINETFSETKKEINKLLNTSSEVNEKFFEKEKEIDDSYMQYYLNFLLKNPDSNEFNESEKEFLKNYHTLTKIEDYETIKPYVRSEHIRINGLLREGKAVTEENILEFIGVQDTPFNREVFATGVIETYKKLEEMIEISELNLIENTKINLFRQIPGNHYSTNDIGDIINEKSFLSTSIDKSYIDSYKDDPHVKQHTLIKFNLPEKTQSLNGIYLGNVEKEFLLPRNMSYRIINKKILEVNGSEKILIEAEFLPNEHLQTRINETVL